METGLYHRDKVAIVPLRSALVWPHRVCQPGLRPTAQDRNGMLDGSREGQEDEIGELENLSGEDWLRELGCSARRGEGFSGTLLAAF